MILPDANLLLYSVNCDSPDHTAAFAWLQRLLQSGQPVGLYTGVAFAFLRLSTNRRVFTNPLQVAEGFAYLNNWLSFPMVALIDAEREDLLPSASNAERQRCYRERIREKLRRLQALGKEPC